MVKLEGMNKEELIEVIRIKDSIISNLKDELDAYRLLVEELQAKLGLRGSNFSGNGD